MRRGAKRWEEVRIEPRKELRKELGRFRPSLQLLLARVFFP